MKRFAFLFLLAGWLVPLASAQETEHFQAGVFADYMRATQTSTNFGGLGARVGWAADGRLVVTDRERAGQGDVAAVGQLVAVGEAVADRGVARGGGRLGEAQGRALDGVDGGRVLVRVDRARAALVGGEAGMAGRAVGHEAGIEVGLGDGVGGAAGDRQAGGQARVGWDRKSVV